MLSLSPFVFSLPDTHIHIHCSSPKPHLSGLLSDRRRSSGNAQLLTNQPQAGTAASTRHGRLPSADQSRDWFIRSSMNCRDTTAPAFLISTTVLEVLGRPDLHQGKLEPAPVKSCTRCGQSFLVRRRHATARLPDI